MQPGASTAPSLYPHNGQINKANAPGCTSPGLSEITPGVSSTPLKDGGRGELLDITGHFGRQALSDPTVADQL